MKKNHRAFALVLAVLLSLSLVTACQSNTPAATPTPASGTKTASPEPSAAVNEEPTGFKLPIAEEKTEFGIWSLGPWSEAGMQTANDSPTRQKIEELTNIHINWQHPAAGQEMEQFNLVVASQSYPDAFFNQMNYYVGGLDKFVDDNVIVDLKPYLAENAPNYMARREEDNYFKFMTVTDEGRMPVLRHFKQDSQPSFMGPMIREDWLKDLSISTPETFTEWKAMLKAFKDQKGADLVQQLGSTGLDQAMMAGFGIAPAFFQMDGTVHYGPLESEYKDYVQTMGEWYSEGLIDPDFFSRGNTLVDTSFVTTGRMGAWTSFYTLIDMYQKQSGDEKYSVAPVAIPVVTKGETRKIVYGSTIYRIGAAVASISTSCTDVATLLKYLDFYYSDEGSLLANFGIEDQSYTYNDQGEPKFTELVAKNPDGLSLGNSIAKYAIHHAQPFWYNWKRELSDYMSDKSKGAGVVWDANYKDERTLPEVSITAEESQVYSRIYNDVNTYVQEMTIKFITDPANLSQYDAFIKEVKALGIDEAIKIQQAAYERYNSRSIS